MQSSLFAFVLKYKRAKVCAGRTYVFRGDLGSAAGIESNEATQMRQHHSNHPSRMCSLLDTLKDNPSMCIPRRITQGWFISQRTPRTTQHKCNSKGKGERWKAEHGADGVNVENGGDRKKSVWENTRQEGKWCSAREPPIAKGIEVKTCETTRKVENGEVVEQCKSQCSKSDCVPLFTSNIADQQHVEFKPRRFQCALVPAKLMQKEECRMQAKQTSGLMEMLQMLQMQVAPV